MYGTADTRDINQVGEAALKVGLGVFLPMMVSYLANSYFQGGSGSAQGPAVPVDASPNHAATGEGGRLQLEAVDMGQTAKVLGGDSSIGEMDWLEFLGQRFGESVVNGMVDQAWGASGDGWVPYVADEVCDQAWGSSGDGWVPYVADEVGDLFDFDFGDFILSGIEALLDPVVEIISELDDIIFG